ncbi:MAG: Hsp20/alpha crystallin family protein [Pseudomonadota bacterium]
MELNDLVPFRHRRRAPVRSKDDNPFERMHEEMDRLFDDFLPQLAGDLDRDRRGGIMASIDLSESDDALELIADLPGLEEDDIAITLRDGALVIRGERKHEHEQKEKNYYRSERAYGSFCRRIALPCDVDEERTEAKFQRGVLTIHLPKSQSAKAKERKIEVRSA